MYREEFSFPLPCARAEEKKEIFRGKKRDRIWRRGKCNHMLEFVMTLQEIFPHTRNDKCQEVNESSENL